MKRRQQFVRPKNANGIGAADDAALAEIILQDLANALVKAAGEADGENPRPLLQVIQESVVQIGQMVGEDRDRTPEDFEPYLGRFGENLAFGRVGHSFRTQHSIRWITRHRSNAAFGDVQRINSRLGDPGAKVGPLDGTPNRGRTVGRSTSGIG